MPKVKTTTQRGCNRFYHGAKISEYQFKRVLISFVRDEPVAVAARHIRLSANSINAVYGRIRAYFTALGVFEDIYRGGNPEDGTSAGEDMEEFEFHLISFHLHRIRRKRRVPDTDLSEVDPHWCESHWRFQYHMMMQGRPSEAIHRMMYTHLLGHIRLCGPIGTPPRNQEVARRLAVQQLDQRIVWFERNAPMFRDEESRMNLRAMRSDQ